MLRPIIIALGCGDENGCHPCVKTGCVVVSAAATVVAIPLVSHCALTHFGLTLAGKAVYAAYGIVPGAVAGGVAAGLRGTSPCGNLGPKSTDDDAKVQVGSTKKIAANYSAASPLVPYNTGDRSCCNTMSNVALGTAAGGAYVPGFVVVGVCAAGASVPSLGSAFAAYLVGAAFWGDATFNPNQKIIEATSAAA